MKLITIAMTLLLSLAAQAESTYHYTCYNRTARTLEDAYLVADVTLSPFQVVVTILKNTDESPVNWKLNQGETLQFLPLTEVPARRELNYYYAYYTTKNKVGSPVEISFHKHDAGMSTLGLAWNIEAIPATKDEVAYGTSGSLICERD